MNMFYKPPVQGRAECNALEQNYQNCIVQKALKDRITSNKCNLDSVLFFHLECPRRVSEYDDAHEFRRKFKDFFSLNRAMIEASKEAYDDIEPIRKEIRKET